jgi:hypothetical protein
MRQPTGFDDGSGRVCRLRKSIYGLRQAGNVWYDKFNQSMTELGYKCLCSDYCAYIRRGDGDAITIAIVWVDDIIGAASNKTLNNNLEKVLASKYEIKAIGEPTLMLGINILRDKSRKLIQLSQSHYIDGILKKFGMQDCSPISTPMDPNVVLEPNERENDTDVESCALFVYATVIGSLLYAAHATRPDILYAVITLAQFTKKPSPTHWSAVKHIFRYLKGTIRLVLTYGGDDTEITKDPDLTQYVDADHGSNYHRKSISGYVSTIAGGAVAWSSKKQSTVALSTAEAEYVAASHAAKQALWHGYLLDEIGITQPQKSILWSDNQAAIAISHSPEFHARTKHIDITLHFVRDYVEAGKLEIKYVPSRDNLADIFTKGLT